MEIAIFYNKRRLPDIDHSVLVKEVAYKIVGPAAKQEKLSAYAIPESGIVKLLIKLKLGQAVIVLNYALSSEEEAMLLEMTSEVFSADISQVGPANIKAQPAS
jgi:hypothetical protein